MAFARTHVGDEGHVALVLDEAQAEEVLDLGSVDLLRPTPVGATRSRLWKLFPL
jgi:hypothetical protein